MNYSAINAKVKAMRHNLLDYEDYRSLSMLGSVEEVGRKLQEYPAYSAILAKLDGEEIHRNLIEQKIILSVAEDFSKIYGFISDFRIRKYMNAFFFSFEKQILNMLLCMVYDERDISFTMPELQKLVGEKLQIDVGKLKNANNVSEFIENLHGTDFQSLLSNAYKEGKGGGLFQLEMQLDLYNYMNVWRQQKKYLDKTNLTVMEKIKGAEVDLRNIMWIYRLKKYYSIEPSHVFAYLIPINYKLKMNQLSRMAEATTDEAFMEELHASPYGKAFVDFTTVEQVFYREMDRAYFKAEATYPNSLAVTVSYMYHKEVEIKNITALLEGVRYSLEPEQIMEHLYMVR